MGKRAFGVTLGMGPRSDLIRKLESGTIAALLFSLKQDTSENGDLFNKQTRQEILLSAHRNHRTNS